MADYEVKIVHLYPELLNLYGDKGNIECLKKRLLWRGIAADVIPCNDEVLDIDFENTDIIFLGGGSEHEQKIVLNRLLNIKSELKSYVENGGTFIALCGGFELICKEIHSKNTTMQGLNLLDISCTIPENENRIIGDVVLENGEFKNKIVGFENHSGRIDIKDYVPLGNVTAGTGSNDGCKTEGVIYKNLFASYLHGPLFPKNPELCDAILTKTLCHKYKDFNGLTPLDDATEIKANEFMVRRLSK